MKVFPPLCIFALLLTGCGQQQQQTLAPGIGVAYAGPSRLPIRQDIDTKSAVITTVSHGDRLEVLQRRRRFVKVRTAARAEGWTDERMLLTPEELSGLRGLSEQSKSAPSQGAATTYETLNVHTEPDRLSPSFLQVKEGEKVDVIGHRVAPRVAPRQATPPPPAVKARPKKSKKDKKASDVPAPPLPAAPQPPADWLELSKLNAAPSAPAAPPEEKAVPTDDWTLIRNAGGQSGWVLTRRLFMSIPDEVAQYAEGHRIVSYFKLGETHDGKDVVKPTWLWTTIDRGAEQYDFDGIRVFVWSTRHHRYETSYIERNLKGYFPVLTGPVPAPKTRKDSAPSSERVPGFSIIVEKKDGFRYRRSFAFLENRVRSSSEERVDTPGQSTPEPAPTLLASEKDAPAADDSFYGSLKQRIRRLFGR
jgi:hypothetical protein